MGNTGFRTVCLAGGFIAVVYLCTAWGQASSPPASPAPSLASLEKEVQEQGERLRQLEQSQHMPETIFREASASVGLIVGEYIWTDRAGRRPLHYQGFDQNGKPRRRGAHRP